jgi:hypothetical protein
MSSNRDAASIAGAGARGHTLGMDHSERAAMRLRADEAMTAALAAADDGASSLALLVRSTMSSIHLACDDAGLDPRARVLIIDDALLLLASLKKLLREAQPPPPEAVMEVLRRTNGLLRRYTRLVR